VPAAAAAPAAAGAAAAAPAAAPDRSVYVPRLPAGTPFLRRYEMAIRYSGLIPSVRLVALTIALHADWDTGVIAGDRPIGYGRIGSATGFTDYKVRELLHALGNAGFIRRLPAPVTHETSRIELLIPAGLDPVR
jgi:hypothetical protein